MKGIDISMHNGNINFDAVKADGVSVVIIKATEGIDYIDPKFEEYYNASANKGFHIGFYHFMSEKTSPTKQAEDFFCALNGKNYDVIPVLDIETNNRGRSATEISDRCIEFLNKFKELSGIDCMIYTGGYFGRDNLDSRVKQYKGWIAHYGVSTPMQTGFNVVGHQYTESGSVSGINGACDVNNFNDGILLSNAVVINNSIEYPYSENLKELQDILGVSSDGYWGPITDSAANSIIAGISYKTPELTKWIQKMLNITIDGVFYTETETAVKNFQASNGLVIDGIVGYNTLKALAFK